MKIKCLILCLFSSFWLIAQDATDPPKWEANGYIKYLHTYFLIKSPPIQLSDQLIHNRLNVSYYPNAHWKVRMDLRNRLFYGERIKITPNFTEQVSDVNNDYFDLSWNLSSSTGHLLHSMVDRLYVEYVKDKWEVRLGRQRINWGISTFWNPHDVFNAFSFTDFDYEERPGSDAVRVKYYSGPTSSIEIALKAADHINQGTVASLWKWNQWNYDFQVLTGYFQDHIVSGIGWAGNLKNAGIKGEWSYFHALEEQVSNAWVGTIGIDYSFLNGTFVQGGFLYNSLGSTQDPIANLFTFQLSAKNVYPYKNAIYLQASHSLSPLVSVNTSLIYSAVKIHPLFINPGITVSISSSWDLDILGQILFSKEDNYTSAVQAFFLRLKYSY